jgi:hypothetical protein
MVGGGGGEGGVVGGCQHITHANSLLFYPTIFYFFVFVEKYDFFLVVSIESQKNKKTKKF